MPIAARPAALVPFRRSQRQASPRIGRERARVGSPASHRSRSSAKAAADSYALAGLLRQALEGDGRQVRIGTVGPQSVGGPAPARSPVGPSRARSLPGTGAGRSALIQDRPEGIHVGRRGESPRRRAPAPGPCSSACRRRPRCAVSPLSPGRPSWPARSRSRTGVPSASSRMFAGFRSRCRMPRWWAWWTARATRVQQADALAAVRVVAVREGCPARLPPSTSFMQKYGLPVVLADLVDGHDVRVVELGRRLRLLTETRRRSASPARSPGQDHLQGDRPIQADLPGLVDDPHAAAGDLRQQFVVAERLHGRQCRRPVQTGRRPRIVRIRHEFAPNRSLSAVLRPWR